MTALSVCLLAALGLALAAVFVLAITLPRRVARIVLADQARRDTRALVTTAALHEAAAAEVAAIVEPLRTLLDEHVQRTLAAHENATTTAAGEVERITASLRMLLDWLFAFAHAQYAQAGGDVEAQETTRKPERTPVSGERSWPRTAAPAVAPPGSALPLPPGPGIIAAGLGPRPSSRLPSPTPPPRPVTQPSPPPRTATMIGIAPPAPLKALGSAPTLLSMQAVPQPSSRPVPPVDVHGRMGGSGQEGAP